MCRGFCRYLPLLGTAVALLLTSGTGCRKQDIPDEKAAAAELLAQKFAGPGYFHFDRPATNHSSQKESEKFTISVADVRSQVGRIVKERQLGPDGAHKLEVLIERLTEPPTSRVVGEVGVNMLRLNLALDELAPSAAQRGPE